MLTAEGARAQRKAWPHYASGIARHFSQHLTDDEKRILAAALRRVREGVTTGQ